LILLNHIPKLIAVSKTVFVSMCIPPVAIRFDMSAQLVPSDLLSCLPAVVCRKWLAVSGGGKVRVLEETGHDK
jgi:hypothetical protein